MHQWSAYSAGSDDVLLQVILNLMPLASFRYSFCWRDLLLGRAIDIDETIVVVVEFANSTAAPATVSAAAQVKQEAS